MAKTYKPEYAEQGRKLALLGATNASLADFFGCSEGCIKGWMNQYDDFRIEVRKGKRQADAEVAHSLYRSAMGYSHPDVHISNYQGVITKTEIVKHYPPHPTSMIFWLKNRCPDLWRDRHELTGKDGKDLANTAPPDVMEVARSLLFILTAADQQASEAIDKAKAIV